MFKGWQIDTLELPLATQMQVLLEKRLPILVGSIVCRSCRLPQRAQDLIMNLCVPLIAAHFLLSPERCFLHCQWRHIWPLFACSNCVKPFINGNYKRVGSSFGEGWGRCIWFPSVLGHPSQIDLDWLLRLAKQVIDGLIHFVLLDLRSSSV